MIDIITVVFQDELPVLKLQAKSIELFCQQLDLNKIVVVINDDNLDTSSIDISWWGKFSDRVVIVHRNSWNVSYSDDGWLTQQLLKMLATDRCQSKWSLVLDAKTIFVRNAIAKEIFDDQQRPCVGVLDIYPVFEPSRTIINQLFNIDLKQQLGPGGVPFFFNNEMIKEMIFTIQDLKQQSFSEWFQEQGMVTEFMLYSGFIIRSFGNYTNLYNTDYSKVHPCNICHSEVDSFDRKITEMRLADTLTVSIHRRAWDNLTDEQQQEYIGLLKQKGIA
jgi:hypothetical protein